MIYSFEGIVPVVHASAFVHPQATLIGNVVVGAGVFIGPGAVLRGDFGGIRVRDGANVQDNCTVHMFPGVEVILEEMAHVGHGAIIHGCHLGRNCLVGMHAVLMDRVRIGEEAIVGALAFLPDGFELPARQIAVGNPVRIVKEVSDEMVAWKTEGTILYQQLAARMKAGLLECQPLSEEPEDRKIQDGGYHMWKKE